MKLKYQTFNKNFKKKNFFKKLQTQHNQSNLHQQ